MGESPKPSLEYDRTGAPSVSVRGMRLLVVLTLINTMVLAWFAVVGQQGPQMIQQRWQQWQRDREVKKVHAKLIGQQQQLMAETFTPGTVVYSEDPARTVTVAEPYQRIQVSRSTVPEWPAPVVREAPAAWKELHNSGSFNVVGPPTVAVFIHERAMPDGQKRLVVAQLEAVQSFAANNAGANADVVRTYRRLHVDAYGMLDPKSGTMQRMAAAVEFRLPSPDVMNVIRASNGSYVVKRGPALTIFTGEPDPADATHLTIPYAIDGQPGTIDVWLRDRDLLVKPRQGLPRFESGREAWELGISPTTGPATGQASRP
jgi:hypothetical protein